MRIKRVFQETNQKKMIRKLIYKSPILIALFCLIQIQGQTFDFETSKDGWEAGFQISSAELDATSGRNSLKGIRSGDNATITLDKNIATINPTTKNYLRLIVKNESNATSFRIRALTTNSSDNTMNFAITAGDTEFKTYLFDLDSNPTWANTTTNAEEVEVRFRQNYAIGEGNIFIDEITFYDSNADTTPPIITVLSGTDSVVEGNTWTDAGATSDGGETVTVSGTVDTNTVGTYTITYSATDAANNTGSATRTVTVTADPNLPINRVLPADNFFYNPTIITGNTMSFPAGDTSFSALQTMIDNLSSSGGGVLTINAGTYTFPGQIHMKNGVHIRVHPDVIFKTTPQQSLFRAGYANSYQNVTNWSFQSTNGEKFTFDFTDILPNADIRAFQLGNTNNFKISDFIVLDNYTKFNSISTGAVGTPSTFPTYGIIENIEVTKAHYGYGLIQCQVGKNLLFRNLSCEGGVNLRLESGFEGLANLYVTDKTLTIDQVYGRNISSTNGAHAVMLSPHTITQGMVDVRDIYGKGCEAVVSINNGFLSADKGQMAPDHSPGTFSEASVITNVHAVFGLNAQVRSVRLKYVPCDLRGYISITKNIDEESYNSPSLAPIYYLALDNYVAFNNPNGGYEVVLKNVTHTGFSSEIREDGLITSSTLNDFENCDISAFVFSDERNTTNPLQIKTAAATNLTVLDGAWENAATWGGTMPTLSNLTNIAHNITINSNVISDGTIILNNNKTLTIASGFSLTLNADISTNDGLILEDGAQLIITGSADGKATYTRNLTTISDSANENLEGWFAVSPPLNGEILNTDWADANSLATGNEGKRGLATYLENNDSYSYFSGISTTFTAGKGYIVKRTVNGDITFTGTLNTSNSGVNMGVTKENSGFNFLGNPYTSNISIGTFINNNVANLNEPQIWIWNDDGNTFNVKTSGIEDKLSPGQGFFVQAKNAATLNFAESNQEIGADTFQKTSQTKIKLNIFNGKTNRYAEIYYLASATKGYDTGYEGEIFGGIPDSFSLYTHLLENNVGKKYQIQSLPNSDFETMAIPVGIKAGTETEFIFTVAATNIPEGLHVFLEDRQENKFIKLDEENATYSVNLSTASEEVGRFYLHTKSAALSTNNDVLTNLRIFNPDNSKLKIIGLQQEKASVVLYTILGKQLLNTSFEAKGSHEISLPILPKGVYIVQLKTQFGCLNKKIILK